MMSNTKNALTYLGRRRIDRQLEGLMEPVGEGVVCYIEGWSDAKVAEWYQNEFGEPCTSANVAGVRKEVYGLLGVRPEPEPPAPVDPEVRLAEVERRLAAVEQRLGLETAS